MKKSTLLLLLCTASVLSLWSCRDDDNEGSESGFSVRGTYPGLVNSASTAIPDGLPFSWLAGDAVWLYIDHANAGSGSNIQASQGGGVTLCGLEEGTGQQIARFTSSEWFSIDKTVVGSRVYYAACPAKNTENSTGVDGNALANNNGTCVFELDRVQTQTKATDLAGLGKYLLMWADPVSDGWSGHIDFKFRHQCAALWFNLRNVPAELGVNAVEIIEVDANGDPLSGASDALCFMTRMELNRQSTAANRTYGNVASGYVNSMRVEMDAPVYGDFTARLAVIPHDRMTNGSAPVNNAKGIGATRHFAVVVHTESDTYTFDRPGERSDWEPGFYHPIDLDFAGKLSDAEDATLTYLSAQYPAWDDPQSLIAASWSANDAIYLYIDNDNAGKGSNIEKTQTENVTICNRTGSGSGFVASPGFTLPTPSSDTRTFYGAYPVRVSGTTGVDADALANDNGTCTYLLSREQTQNASASNLRDYLLMWADPIADIDRPAGNLQFAFNHLCAALEFNIRNLPLGMSVSGVEIKEVNAYGQAVGGGSSYLCFMNRMELNRTSSGGNLSFGEVETGYYGSMKVDLPTPLTGSKVTARIAVIPHDFMTDEDGESVNNAKGPGAVRHFAVSVTTSKGTYTFDQYDTPSYWEPGKLYAMTLDFTGMVADVPPPPASTGEDFENGGSF